MNATPHPKPAPQARQDPLSAGLHPRPPMTRTVVGLTLAVLLASLGTSVANVALPSLAIEFGITPGQAQWIVLAYLLSMTATAVQVGRLGDRIGRRRTLLLGLVVFLAATLACAVAPSFAMLIGARAIQGIGAAVLVALPLALARDLAAPERLGSVMGGLGAAAAVGTSLGPAGGGVLLGAFGWQSMFLAVVPLGVVACVLLSGAVPSALPAAQVAGPNGSVGGTARSGTLVLLRNRPFRAALTMNLLVATVMMSTLIVGPFFLTSGLDLPVAAVGLAMAVGPAVAAVSGVLAGRAVDRAGAARGTTLGLGIMVLGMLALVVLPGPLGLTGYVLALVILTPGYQLFLAANNTAALSTIGSQSRGASAGLLSLSRNLGLIVGASVMGALYAFAAESAASWGVDGTGAALRGAQTAFALGIVLVGLALLLSVNAARGRGPAWVESGGSDSDSDSAS